MKKREREQVVELLRCAHDEWSRGVTIDSAWEAFDESTQDEAVSAWVHVLYDPCMDDEENGFVLLEAAARVEEGSWP